MINLLSGWLVAGVMLLTLPIIVIIEFCVVATHVCTNMYLICSALFGLNAANAAAKWVSGGKRDKKSTNI